MLKVETIRDKTDSFDHEERRALLPKPTTKTAKGSDSLGNIFIACEAKESFDNCNT